MLLIEGALLLSFSKGDQYKQKILGENTYKMCVLTRETGLALSLYFVRKLSRTPNIRY